MAELARRVPQSLEFLVVVGNFEKTLRTATARNDGTEFDTFMEIVDKFIKSDSRFEVNIDDKTRGNILAKMGTFKELPLVRAADTEILESKKRPRRLAKDPIIVTNVIRSLE